MLNRRREGRAETEGQDLAVDARVRARKWTVVEDRVRVRRTAADRRFYGRREVDSESCSSKRFHSQYE